MINKNKLKLDLFEKRYEVYKYIRVFIANTLSHGNVTDDELNDFIRNTMKNIFLFKEDVSKYIEEIDRKAQELQKLERQLETVGTEDIINKRMEVFNWFTGQFENSKNIFSNYLRIDDK